MPEEDEGRMVNVRLRGEVLRQFNEMLDKDMRDQSSMLRWLISQEYARRTEQPTLFEIEKRSDA